MKKKCCLQFVLCYYAGKLNVRHQHEPIVEGKRAYLGLVRKTRCMNCDATRRVLLDPTSNFSVPPSTPRSQATSPRVRVRLTIKLKHHCRHICDDDSSLSRGGLSCRGLMDLSSSNITSVTFQALVRYQERQKKQSIIAQWALVKAT